MSSAKKYCHHKTTALLFWAILLIVFYYYKNSNQLSWIDLTKNLYHLLADHKIGFIFFIGIHLIRPFILFPAGLLNILGGNLFGLSGGILVNIIGDNLSAWIVYFFGRWLGKKPIDDEEEGFLRHWKKGLKKNSFITILVIRLIYIPFDVASYIAGLLHINWKDFSLGTFLGIMPSLITLVSFGASIKNIDTFDLNQITFDIKQLILSVILFVFSLVLAHYLQKRERKIIGKVN